MPRSLPSISQIIERFPDDRQRLVASAERITRYEQECGCTAGAVALTLATMLVVVYFLRPEWFPSFGRPVSRLWAFPFVFVVTGAAKAGSILVARLRIVLLRRQIYTRYGLR